MADVGLHCAERALAGLPSATGPKLVQAGEFHGVANGRAGGMALDEFDALGFPARRIVGEAEGAELAFARGREEVAIEVVAEADAADESVDFVAVAEGVGEALEKNDACAFADDEAAGGGIEGRATAGGRERAKLREPHLRVERVGTRDTSGEHGVNTAGVEFVAGELDGVERGGARGVEGARAATKAEGLREEASGEAGDVAVERVRLEGG